MPFDLIRLGSSSPVKRQATIDAARAFFGRAVDVELCSVDSGVRPQPLSDEETRKGAMNRLRALGDLASQSSKNCVLVAVESGLDRRHDAWFLVSWVAVQVHDTFALSRVAAIQLPERLAKLSTSGHELKEAAAIHFGAAPRPEAGIVGTLTNGRVTRLDLYRDGIILAFATAVA